MDYEKWAFASSIATMVMTFIALIAAVTYYFSLADLELRYYFYTYLVLGAIVIFIFIAIGLNPRGGAV